MKEQSQSGWLIEDYLEITVTLAVGGYFLFPENLLTMYSNNFIVKNCALQGRGNRAKIGL